MNKRPLVEGESVRRGQKRKKLGIKDKEGRFLLMPQERRVTGREVKKLSKKGDSDSGPFPKLTQFEICIFLLNICYLIFSRGEANKQKRSAISKKHNS